jgi:glycosyltransferase involved in cell wall biosynthesis
MAQTIRFNGAGMTPEVSVVLPCYGSAPLAIASVYRLDTFFRESGMSAEIIVVDDGGGDFPSEPWDATLSARLVRLPKNRGKGAAVAVGMRAGTAPVRVFTDVDLPYDLDLIPVIVGYIRDYGFHVVIGDRTLPDSLYLSDLSLQRRLASELFSQFVGRLVTGGFFDTQCGLKGMRGDVADELFRLQRLERFSFDVELVYLALKHKLDIKRIPVQLRNNETSTVRLLRDASQAVIDVFRIKWNQLRGNYRSTVLDNTVRTDYRRVFEASQTRSNGIATESDHSRPREVLAE